MVLTVITRNKGRQALLMCKVQSWNKCMVFNRNSSCLQLAILCMRGRFYLSSRQSLCYFPYLVSIAPLLFCVCRVSGETVNSKQNLLLSFGTVLKGGLWQRYNILLCESLAEIRISVPPRELFPVTDTIWLQCLLTWKYRLVQLQWV